MSAAPSEIIFVSLDDDFIKLAKTKKTGERYFITHISSRSIRGLVMSDMAREASLALAELKTKCRNAVLVLPAKYAITKNIEVPSLDPQEIESIVRLQAVRHTPYAREEVIIGHLNLEVLLERYTRSLLVIVSNDNVRNRTDILEVAGLEVQAVRFSSEVCAKALDILYPGSIENTPAGILFVNQESADFMIEQKSLPYFIRNIPIGFKQLKEDFAVNSKQLLEELKKTIEAYQKEEQGVPLKSFLVQGPKAAPVEPLLQSLQEEFKIPAKALSWGSGAPMAPSALAQALAAETVNYAEVVSAVAAENLASIDLIPEEVKVRRSFKSKGQEIFTAGIFVLAIFALIIGIFLTKIYFRDTYLKEIHRNFEIKQKEADELVKISEKARLVKDFKAKKGIALKVLDQSQAVLPQQMYLSEISLTSEGKLGMKGTSELMSTVFSFVTLLDNHPLFQNVTSDYTKSRKENDKDVSDFGISAGLEEGEHHG